MLSCLLSLLHSFECTSRLIYHTSCTFVQKMIKFRRMPHMRRQDINSEENNMRLSPLMITLLIILAVLIVVLIVLYFWGKKLQKRQDESQAQMEATKQTVQIFVIDKKMLPLKQSGLPQIVIDQTPKLMRRSKMPIVKARVQGRIMTLVADQKVFPLIPVGKEVKATVSGIYIMDVKAIRGKLEAPPQKKKWYQRFKKS